MTQGWYSTYRFPITLPTDSIPYNHPSYESLFIRTKVYDELDEFLSGIKGQRGKFWVSSTQAGYGKSTMLNYIKRYLLQNKSTIGALPFLVTVGGNSEAEFLERFCRGFVHQYCHVEENLGLFHDGDATQFQGVIEDLRQNHELIEMLKNEVDTSDLTKLETEFWKVCSVLKKWRDEEIFSKYVLLLDEVDKASTEAAASFLRKHQTAIFERLYNELEFVVFFSGERSWVNSILEGTELSYYHGKTFDVSSLVDLGDVRKLVESRLQLNPPGMNSEDNPFTNEAFDELRKATDGQPREILIDASEVINRAAKAKLKDIDKNFTGEVLARLEVSKAREFFETHYAVYDKLSKAGGINLMLILAWYRYNPNHEIPKELDSDPQKRNVIGLEISNEKWLVCIDEMTKLDILREKQTTRQLSPDIAECLSLMDAKGIGLDSMPYFLAEMVIQPRIVERAEPNYFIAIKRPFKSNPSSWFTKEELFVWFYETTDVTQYFKAAQSGQSQEDNARKVFEREFKKYIDVYGQEVLTYPAPTGLVYRSKPADVPKEVFDNLKRFGSRNLIDKFIELTGTPSPQILRTEGTKLINELLKLNGLKPGLREDVRMFPENETETIQGLTNECKGRLVSFSFLATSDDANTELMRPAFKRVVECLARMSKWSRSRTT